MTDDLFSLALDLVTIRKPKLKQVAVRKAVSAAYYGLFHALLTMLADTIAGKGKSRTPEYAAIYRIPDHGRFYGRCWTARTAMCKPSRRS